MSPDFIWTVIMGVLIVQAICLVGLTITLMIRIDR
jgi:hypothetical protein